MTSLAAYISKTWNNNASGTSFKWRRRENFPRKHSFCGSPGLKVQTPLQIFKEFLAHVVEETNRYVELMLITLSSVYQCCSADWEGKEPWPEVAARDSSSVTATLVWRSSWSWAGSVGSLLVTQSGSCDCPWHIIVCRQNDRIPSCSVHLSSSAI